MARQKVAFIGLGNMGGGMALNLLAAGYDVQAYDLVAELMEPAVAQGAVAHTCAEDAVAGADFVVSMLPSGKIVESLYIHDTRLLEHIAAATLVIDCSTVAAGNSRALAAAAAERGIRAIDAPVSGGIAAAAAGTLAFMCGGSEEAVQAARPVLEAMGANVFRAGDSGAGQIAKICNNMLLAVHMIGTAEALQLGVNSGLDPKVLSDIMLKSSGCNWSLEKYNPYPGVMEGSAASRDYQGGFMVKLMQKDLGLAMTAIADSDSNAPMGTLANSLYGAHASDDAGNPDLDFSSIQRMFSS